MIFFAQTLDQVAGVDIHRTCSSAESVDRAGIYPVILVLIEEELVV